MDFTQIMQRYTRLRERYEQGEIDADSFEQQVNGMIYKDEDGRYWQIGVQTGLWYYYDGAKWVQDDLIDESVEEPPEEPELEMAAIDAIFPKDETEPEPEPSPFDMAFEEQLASQFAESGDSQVFDVFDNNDIFASILKGKGMEDDDPLAAPAEEVEGLAEHLETTQPVSIESLMGEGTAISTEDNNGGLDFLFEDSEASEFPEIQEGNQMDLSAVLGVDFPEADELQEIEYSETDVRDVGEKEVVTGELQMPVEPLTKDALDSLMGEDNEVDYDLEEEPSTEDETMAEAPFEMPEVQPALDWDLEPEDMQETPVVNNDLPDSPMLEVLDDDFSLDDLVTDSQRIYLEETQPVPSSTASEFYEEPEEEDFFGTDDVAPFEIPLQSEEPPINTVPDEVSAPVGETMQSARPIRSKRKLPLWVTLLIIFIIVFGLAMVLLLAWNMISSVGQIEVPIISDIANSSSNIHQDDPNLLIYDDFDGETKEDWSETNDYNTGVAGYHTGFYYLYSMAPEVPTTSSVDMVISDVIIDVESTQLNKDHSDILSTYGVMCRVQENGDGYAFRITNNGQYVIEKYQGGVFTPLNNWAYSEVIKANKELNKNHIEVGCVGTQLTFTVNGHLLDVAVDGTWMSGKPGFVAQTGAQSAFTEVHYDELYLLKP